MAEGMPPRFWARIQVNPVSGCWEYGGPLNAHSYGIFRIRSLGTLAHRVTYQTLVGEIPEGLFCDHLCRVRHCCNPTHIELVSNGENVRRGLAGRWGRAKTHCPHGHEYTEANTIVKLTRGHINRMCKVCARRRSTAFKAKQRALRYGSPSGE